ncbi:MAG: glycosyltransferase [Siphonobacter sp.]
MIIIGLFLLGFCLVVQLIYVIFFSKTAFFRPEELLPSVAQPGVSVIVCAWNELPNLQELLPILENQVYSTFEVIIVNDRSTDGTYEFLQFERIPKPFIRFIHIESTPHHIAAKKYALTRGIQAAHYETILLTDADCRPASDYWIQHMIQQMKPGKEIVLGFSPYFPAESFLNRFIQFETFYTALQYFSLALAGKPYMAVGRNLMYQKKLFLKHKGFHGFLNILGGDDDLFINKAATSQNTAVCLHPDSFMYSVPKQTWPEWLHQKRRHLSVGGYYKLSNKLMLGCLAASHVFSWLLFFGLTALLLLTHQYTTFYWVMGLFGLRTGLVWFIWSKSNKVLGHTFSNGAIPFFDFLVMVYTITMGVFTTFFKKKVTWR